MNGPVLLWLVIAIGIQWYVIYTAVKSAIRDARRQQDREAGR